MRLDPRRLAPGRVAASVIRRGGSLVRAARARVIVARNSVRAYFDPNEPSTDLRRLRASNRWSRRSILGDGPLVTLTTYGHRAETAFLAIESIARGELRPKRMELWIDDVELYRHPPTTLRRLERRGLTLRHSRNYGPHTKYYPHVAESDVLDEPIVTADDDIVYPSDWLAELAAANREAPDLVQCFRAHRIPMLEHGFAPYVTWQPCQSTTPSLLNFPTGVSGVIYPARFLRYVRGQGEAFLEHCAEADDVWLHKCAVSLGIPARQIRPESLHFEMIPGSQIQALQAANVHRGENDRQIAATYTESDIVRLRGESA